MIPIIQFKQLETFQEEHDKWQIEKEELLSELDGVTHEPNASVSPQKQKVSPQKHKYYGSTIISESTKTKSESTKEEKIGGRTIVDLHSCLDVGIVCLWLFSICARPTIISTIHLLLFSIYVIIGGIILYEPTKKNKTSLLYQQSPKYSKKKKMKKKKKYKLELTDLSESLMSRSPPMHFNNNYNKQISPLRNKNISHLPGRYGVDSMIMIIIAIYCTVIALLQIINQILIAADVINGNNNALKMFGFQEPQPNKKYEWGLYLSLDLILCVLTIGLSYKWSRLNIINVEKVLWILRKSLPILDIHHYKLSDILSDDDDDDDDDDIEYSSNREILSYVIGRKCN